MGQDQSRNTPRTLKKSNMVELINEWNLTTDNDIWLNINKQISIIQEINCFYEKIGLKHRGLPCISVKLEGGGPPVKMPTCFFRIYLQKSFGNKLSSKITPELLELKFKRSKNHSLDDHLSNWSHDILQKTYKKLNIPCKDGCFDNMPEAFAKMVREMKLKIDILESQSGWFLESEEKVTPLEYINMYACMLNQPPEWKISFPTTLTLSHLSLSNLRPSNYFFGSTSAFKFN